MKFSDPSSRAPRLPATVVSLGLVSLFTDVSSEAIFPLLPAFLVSLGATGAFIGLVEGVAEVVANTLKYAMGPIVDRSARLKRFVLVGYGLSTVIRPMAAIATAPWHVLLVRAGDRIGKGIRTTPRDALIASATDRSMRARAFGFHRAMDHAGAAIGTLMAAGLLWLLGASSHSSPENTTRMREVFWWAAVPGFIAMVVLARSVEPAVSSGDTPKRDMPVSLSQPLKRLLLVLTLFALANATDAFVIVKAAKLGAAPTLAPLLWLVLHVVKASTGASGGRLADRYGKRNSLILGWLVYAALWAAIGFAGSLGSLFLLTALYGTSHGLVEGAERGLVADLAPGHKRGTAFGAYNLLIGMAALAASTAFGAAWDRFGSVVAFCGSASFALLAAVLLFVLLPNHQAADPNERT
jgi:MFS family permease